MGGSLQPFFAERNMEAEKAMTSNKYRAPAAEGRTDAELAVSVAALEHQQQERQRRASQQRQAESDADMARRVAYQQAQQSYAHHQQQQQQYAQPSYGQPSYGQASYGPMPQSHREPMPPLSGSFPVAYGMSGTAPRHQRSVSYDATMQPQHTHAQTAPLGKVAGGGQAPQQMSQTTKPASFLETHEQMLEVQHRRAATCDGLPHIRVTKDNCRAHDPSDPVAHVLAGLPPPPSPMAGGGEPTTQQPTQSWNNGSGAHWDSEITRQMSGQHMVPLQPRVNPASALNVPPESSATARARLESRLKLYGLCERKIKGDGACQFRSVSDQLYRTQDHHLEVRRVAVHQLRSNFHKYSQFVPSDYWRYVYEMEQPETWGDHICLQAIADAYGLKINIITSYPHQDSCFIGITPQTVKTHRILYLSFWAEIHYNSIYPKSEPPASEKFLGSKKLARWLA